jgi:hypothetical protein
VFAHSECFDKEIERSGTQPLAVERLAHRLSKTSVINAGWLVALLLTSQYPSYSVVVDLIAANLLCLALPLRPIRPRLLQ